MAMATDVKDSTLLEEKLKVAVASGAAVLMVDGIATGQKLHTRRS